MRGRPILAAALFLFSAPTGAATMDADSARAPVIDTLVTRSGHWRLLDAGRAGELSRYLWTLDEAPAFVRVMVCRRAFTHEAGDSDALNLTPVDATVRHKGEVHRWKLQVAQGSCRVAQNREPVTPNAGWLRAAVKVGRLPAYRRESSFKPMARAGLMRDPRNISAYDPGSIGGESSSNNFVGVTSAQGGEYSASRGFIHDVDARVIDAALHDEDIVRTWDQVAALSWYSLSQPQGAVWSPVNHVSVDPQFPQAGDRPWEIANAGQRVRPDIDSVIPTERWTRDLAHLENTGFIHWIVTEDPVAGLVVQRQAAYALASWYEYRRKKGDTRYQAGDEQERGVYNLLGAAWKARDISTRVASAKGSVIWRPARTAKMGEDLIVDLDTRWYKPMVAATAGPSNEWARKLAGLPLSDTFPTRWERADGGPEMALRGTSAFMLPQYGKEPLYLWSRAGDPRVRRWFATAARHLTIRVLYVGGARGIDRLENVTGSGFPVAPMGTPPFTDPRGWAAWAKALPVTAGPTDRFDGAALHTLTQVRGTLRLAKGAGLAVAELNEALARIEADWQRTLKPRYADLESAKHWAAPE